MKQKNYYVLDLYYNNPHKKNINQIEWYKAVRSGSVDVVSTMLKYAKIDVDNQDYYGWVTLF